MGTTLFKGYNVEKTQISKGGQELLWKIYSG
jgi:hypothetical protein